MILITGAAGLLGANLVADFARKGFEVVAVDRAYTPTFKDVRSVTCDLTSAERVASLFKDYRPKSVVHCAALTDVDLCEANPLKAWRVNVEMSGSLASLAAEGGSRFVYISTDSVFDGARGAYGEGDSTGPLNAYARTKLHGETAVCTALPDALLLRTNIYGWNMQPKQSLAEWIINRLDSGMNVPGFRDVVFCPILVNHLGDVILDLLKRKATGLFHVVGSDACSKYEFALGIAGAFGFNPSLVLASTLEQAALRAPRPKDTSLDTAKIRAALGRSMPSLDDGLKLFKALRDGGFVAHLKQQGKEYRDA